MSAVGDTGATRTLLTVEASRPYKLMELDPREGRVVEYGGGEKGEVAAKVQLGELEALVVPGLRENLVSISELTERGSILTLSDTGGVISNALNDKKIKLWKDYGTWRLYLQDLADYNHKEKSYVKAFYVAASKSKAERYVELHERLGHLNWRIIAEMLDERSQVCIRAGITAQEVREVGARYQCVSCLMTKRRAKSVSFNLEEPEGFQSSINSKTATAGQIISIDPVGPITPLSIGGFSLMWCVIDVGSSYMWIYFSKSKEPAVVIQILKLVIADLIFFGKSLKIVRTDAEEIFSSREVQNFLLEKGVKHQYSVPYEHYQNRVERTIQQLIRGVSVLMHSQRFLPASCWEYAARHVMKISRFVPTVKTKPETPSRLMGGGDLDLTVHLPFTFGDFVAVRIPQPEKTWRFDVRRDVGIYLGDAEDTKRGSLIYMLASGVVRVRADCVHLKVSEDEIMSSVKARTRLFDKVSPAKKVKGAKINFEEEFEDTSESVLPLKFSWSDLDGSQGGAASGGEEKDGAVQFPNERRNAQSEVQEEFLPEEKTFRNLRKHPRFMYASMEGLPMRQKSLTADFETPRAYSSKVTVGSALKTAESAEWIVAIRTEIEQMMATGTLEAVKQAEVQRGATIINSTMVLVQKPEKKKARLCACGNELKGKINELYSPTIGALTYSTVHQLAVIDRMKVRIIDTVGAYLYQTYPSSKPPIYIRMPAKVMSALGIPEETVYRIKKYIYGLPDSGRAYYLAYAKLLQEAGYEKAKSDPCLFFRLSGGERIYIWIHVDDTFVAATSEELLQELEDVIRKQYTITVKRDVESYLGVKFEHFSNGDVKLTQPKLLNALLEEYEDELEKHRARVPMSPQRLQASQSKDDEPMDPSAYLHLEGALIYLTKSRPDIQTAVSFGATHSKSPTRGDFEELIHCLKYLESTREEGLILKAGVADRELILKCYVDASYLTHPDSKSHQGYCMSFGDVGSFYSKSSKQQLVATSSTHSEMRALQSLVVDVVFIVELCKELGRPIKLPVIVFEDNGAVISLSREMTSRAKRCKHFLMLIAWIREQVEAGLITLQQIPDEENNADMLTKIITATPFKTKAGKLLGRE